jgi:predicted SAM-dependent methyltransferase
MVIDPELQALAPRRLNVGCGMYPLLYWVNADMNPECPADLHVKMPPIPYADGALDEIYAGHFLEHLTPDEATEFLQECYRCLSPGGRLGIVVPDTREIMKRHLRRDIDQIEHPRGCWTRIADLDDVCALFFYSTVQESGHKWSYDLDTLARKLKGAGFVIVGEIDRFHDARLGSAQWFQCGIDCVKPAETA